jgi:uncharacterized protein YoxC
MLVIDPIFWLGLSILLVAVSLTAVLIVAVPALQELGRAARSAEKLFDTLNRELPPTLEAMRLTGLEVSELTDDMSQGVQSAGQVVKQVDQSITGVKQQVQKAQVTSRSVLAGVKTAWRTFTQPPGTTASQSRRAEFPSDPSELGKANRNSPRLPSSRSELIRETQRSSQRERYRDDSDFEPPYLELEDYDDLDDLVDEPLDEQLLQAEQNLNNRNHGISENQDSTRSPDLQPAQRENEY